MIEINIPGFKNLKLSHLVLDYNGTLALDGAPIDGVARRLNDLAAKIEIHVLTADTFGSVHKALANVDCTVSILPPGSQDEAKLNYVRQLGAGNAVCIGNGRNDALMLDEAALGIAVVQAECASVKTVIAADILAPDIHAALDLLQQPLRLIATLRS